MTGLVETRFETVQESLKLFLVFTACNPIWLLCSFRNLSKDNPPWWFVGKGQPEILAGAGAAARSQGQLVEHPARRRFVVLLGKQALFGARVEGRGMALGGENLPQLSAAGLVRAPGIFIPEL